MTKRWCCGFVWFSRVFASVGLHSAVSWKLNTPAYKTPAASSRYNFLVIPAHFQLPLEPRAHNSTQSSLSKIEINSAIPSNFNLRASSQLDYYQLAANCLPRKQLDWMDELVRFLRRRLRFIISSLRRLKSACRSCSVNKCDSLDSFPEFSSLL